MESYFSRTLSNTPFEENEDKKYEFCRLLTFANWPESSPIFPTRLAQAGFYYLGQDDNVKCYKCTITKCDWKEGDKPTLVHIELNRDCPFLQSGEDNIPIQKLQVCSETSEGSETTNTEVLDQVPVISESEGTPSGPTLSSSGNSNSSGSEGTTDIKTTSEPGVVNTEQGASSDRNSGTTDTENSTGTATATGPSVGEPSSLPVTASPREEISQAAEGQSKKTGKTLDRSKSDKGLVEASSNSSLDETGRKRSRKRNIADSSSRRNTSSPSTGQGSSSGSSRSSADDTSSRMSQGKDIPPPTGESIGPLRFERNRLETFRTWPSTAKVSSTDLARSGFSYTGSGDRAQCIFCKGILRNWEEGDQPHIEHRKHFPRCPLVLGMNVGNVRLPLDQNPGTLSQSQPRLPLNVNVSDAMTNMEALGINTDRPKHPQYAIESTRLTSYQNWPSYKHQTPQMLAASGFFYAGFSDNVKCFYCDGGLRNWEKGDEPWQEHARWFPRCPFVLQVKGQDFVNSIQGETRSDVPLLAQRQGQQSFIKRAQAQVLRPGPGRYQVEDREVRARMDTPTIQLALNMNVSRDTVMVVVRKRLEETGDDFPNAQSLLEAVFEYEERQKRLKELGPATSSQDDETRSQAQSSAAESNSSTNENVETAPTSLPGNEPSTSSAEIKDKTGSSSDLGEMKTDETEPETKELIRENMELKEQRLCKICMVAEANVVFLPCAHLVSCAACAPALRQCPICRANIKGTIRTYLS